MTLFNGSILQNFTTGSLPQTLTNGTFASLDAARTCIHWCQEQHFTYHYQPLYIIVVVLLGELLVDGLWRFRHHFNREDTRWFYGMIEQELIRRSWNLAKYTLLVGYLLYTLYGG